MEIKASSKYDWETIKTFNNFNNFVRHKAMIVIWIITAVCVLLAFVIMLALGEMTLQFALLTGVFALLSFGALYCFWVLPKKQYSKDNLTRDVESEILFTEEKMCLSQKGPNTSSSGNFAYNTIWRVYETDKFIYIYIDPLRAYIVEKSTLEGAPSMELRLLLVRKIGADKYKIKCKP